MKWFTTNNKDKIPWIEVNTFVDVVEVGGGVHEGGETGDGGIGGGADTDGWEGGEDDTGGSEIGGAITGVTDTDGREGGGDDTGPGGTEANGTDAGGTETDGADPGGTEIWDDVTGSVVADGEETEATGTVDVVVEEVVDAAVNVDCLGFWVKS